MSKEIATVSDVEKALIESTVEAFGDDSDLQIPILKVTQALTNEVKSGDARPGEFVNSLSGDVLHGPIEFIVCGFERGRFRTNDKGEVVCNGREGVCGCHGTDYTECPDSEEQFRAAVKRGDREWGKGPPCSTTYNFSGIVVGYDMPVRLSLMRMGSKPAKKLLTLLRFSKAPWDRIYELDIAEQHKDAYDYYALTVKQGRQTEPEERQAAVALAQALRDRNVDIVGEESIGEAEGEARPAEQSDDKIDY